MPRFWTTEQANRALPEITALVESVQAGVARSSSRSDPRLLVHGAARLLAVDGVVLRDPDRGLVDFPARSPSGRRYWLCWVVGEPAVTWWHWPEDGFAGRTPLSEPPG